MATQADQVRNDILGRVRSRSLMPGDRIDEDDLRDRLSLSGTPVREALISLEAMGIVQRIPRSGACIASLDLEGMSKMIEVLAELEGSVAYRAARRINNAQAKVLKMANQACRDHANTPNQPWDSYYDVNLVFHTALLDAAGNEHLKEVTLQVGNRLIAYLSARHCLPGEPQRSARDHEEICKAVFASDSELARDLSIRHVIFSDIQALDVMNTMQAGDN